MAIVLVEVFDAPAGAALARTVKEFRRAHPDVFKTTLHVHRSAEDRALAAAFGVRRSPGFVFTDDQGNTLARVRGTSLAALEAALERARAGGTRNAAKPRPVRPPRNRFVAENVGCVSQNRRNIVIEGLQPSFKPTAKALRAIECASWSRGERGYVTAVFPTIRAAEKAFNRLLDEDPLRMHKALPDEVAWIKESE